MHNDSTFCVASVRTYISALVFRCDPCLLLLILYFILYLLSFFFFFFFFKQKTAYEMRISDWSSDVCSSDLASMPMAGAALMPHQNRRFSIALSRSEERRVGKECVSTCRSRWSPYH